MSSQLPSGLAFTTASDASYDAYATPLGEVRGLGVFWAIELVRDRKTREPLVPFNASGADAKPMAELMAACKTNGVWPFAHFNRLQVTPPCTTSDDETRQGLAAIDKALEVADRYAKA